jgi:hypothetical protein
MLSMCLTHLGGVMVSMLAIGSKVCGFKVSLGDGFLKAIKMFLQRGSNARVPML